MERTLILNAGSSSVKFRLYVDGKQVLEGMIDRIGPDSILVMEEERPCRAADYKEAGLVILSLAEEPDMVVHRVVHGGKREEPVVITGKVRDELNGLVELAPLHMPAALELIDLFSERTSARQVACFDTMFHRTMPLVARTYAIPKELARKHRIEHYGFHGIAHSSMMRLVADELGKKTGSLNLITCQLGNGASLCAIREGESVDTSMGFTPLEGLMMGTRSGDLDPAIVEFLCEKEGKTVEEIMDILEKESGFKGLTGTNDVRDLLKRKDPAAKLALDMFSYRVRKLIGGYWAVLGRVDAIVLGGGISQAPEMRKRILSGLEHLGVVRKDSMKGKVLTKGKVPAYAVTVDEQEEMFSLTEPLRSRR